jgi:pimeloyl-ACP methyl ester carboxylesterase
VARRTLLLLHGWPLGSVLELARAVPILTQPQCLYGPREGRGKDDGAEEEEEGGEEEEPVCVAFDVVAPSLPGLGWSDAAVGPETFDALAVARTLLALMEQLGENEFWVQVN